MSLLSKGCLGFLLTGSVIVTFLAADAKAQPNPQIANLIKQLGHEEYREREAANTELEEVGEKALPSLKDAVATSDSPEIRLRAQRIIRAILWRNRWSKSLALEMIPINSGEFLIGSPKSEAYRRPDETQHKVRINRAFYLGVHEVTQEQYRKVTERDPSWFTEIGGGKDRVKGLDTKAFPVDSVTWFDAIDFCNRLSKLDGYEPHYQLTEVKLETGSIASATVTTLGGKGYRLPTEAEWEYACRAGGDRAFHFGYQNTGREANLKPSPSAGGYGGPPTWTPVGRPTKVGSYKANPWLLYDMHGNVGEWCGDWYDEDYAKSPPNDPNGPDKGTHRVVRSGSWMLPEGSCRSASRFSLMPDERKDYVGFRVARTP